MSPPPPAKKTAIPIDQVKNLILVGEWEDFERRFPQRFASGGAMASGASAASGFSQGNAPVPTTSTLVTSVFTVQGSGGSGAVTTEQHTIFVTPTNSPSSSPSPHQSQDDTGLSSGTIAGIAVGAAVAIAAIAALTFLLVRQRSKARRSNLQTAIMNEITNEKSPNKDNAIGVSELYSEPVETQADNGTVSELPGTIAELSNSKSVSKPSKTD